MTTQDTSSLNSNMFNKSNTNLRPYKPFGLNVVVPEKTLKKVGETIKEATNAPVNSMLGYLAKNEDVFNGKVQRETNDLFLQGFNTTQLMNAASLEPEHKFEMHM